MVRSAVSRNEGPHRANEAVESYLRGEQERGGIARGANPRAAADMLLGTCFQQAFQTRFLDRELSLQERLGFVRLLLDTLSQGLEIELTEG
ncbi:TetR family transcriptional regulator [Paenibacillus flagellatus]|uniref:TetR family transcriptional regulator n=1 Tax=Paenibacillus flagellatus TaxID=2211139 RepID=A0A2V5K2X9_9BACL|nr:TetR family transcriptional regulator [Paenibacillus flagellatus]